MASQLQEEIVSIQQLVEINGLKIGKKTTKQLISMTEQNGFNQNSVLEFLIGVVQNSKRKMISQKDLSLIETLENM